MIIDFQAHHSIKVKLKAPQSADQCLRQALNTRPFDSIHLLIALLAEKLIAPIEDIPLNIRLQALINGLLILHRQRNRNKRLDTLRRVLAVLPNDLIGRLAAEVFPYGLLRGRAFELALEAVHEHLVELFYVHLDRDVGRVAVPVFEGFGEGFRVRVLLFGLEQQREEELELV